MEKNWYYSADGQDKKGPIPESELKQLLASGQVTAGTLVWSEGMANWAPAASVAALNQPAAAAASAEAAPVVTAAITGGAQVPQGLGSWMTFVAVMHIIGGAFACLSCIYILYGVPLIISGVGLLGAKGLLITLPSVDATMLPFLEKLRYAFKAAGWAYILMFISVVVFLIVYGVFIAALITRMPAMR